MIILHTGVKMMHSTILNDSLYVRTISHAYIQRVTNRIFPAPSRLQFYLYCPQCNFFMPFGNNMPRSPFGVCSLTKKALVPLWMDVNERELRRYGDTTRLRGVRHGIWSGFVYHALSRYIKVGENDIGYYL